MASPASTEEVSGFMRLCARHGTPVILQGGNSGMSGGATPDGSGEQVLLSLRRLDAIRTIDARARQAVCEAGVILQHLHDAAADADLRFPLTLGGKGSATIGGLIATNAGGTQVLRHGTMRAQVLGVEAVLADGRVLDLLPALKKDNRGFDLKQLLIGSEGTLGIVTAARLRLLPAVQSRATAWVGMSSPGSAADLLRCCQTNLDEALEGFEILPHHSLDAVIAHLPNARPPLNDRHEWHALIECVGPEELGGALRERLETVLATAIEDGTIEDAAIATNEAQAEAMWALRESIAPAERALGPAIQHDVSVPVERMSAFIEQALPHIETRFPGTRAIAFGHLGDGNVHLHVLAPPGAGSDWAVGRGPAVTRAVHDMVAAWDGSISAEHGIGQAKREELQRLGDPVALAVMRRIKAALDPDGLLNPGRLLPLAPPPAAP